MASSVTGGGLVFSYNSMLQRGLNLLDLQDPATSRLNLGITPANLGLQALTFGTGLNSGSFNGVTSSTISVNSSTNGTASTIAAYDSSGSFTTGGNLTLGGTVININGGTASTLASLTRGSGTNGNLTLQNTGTGSVTIQGANGPVNIQSLGSTATISTMSGTTINAAQPGGASSVALTVTGPSSGTGLVVTGGATIDSITGTCISDATNGTSSTVAASNKAVGSLNTTLAASIASVATTAANKLDLTTASTQSVASTVTFNGGVSVPGAATIATNGCTISGGAAFSSAPNFNAGIILGANKINWNSVYYTATNGAYTSLTAANPMAAATMVESLNDFGTGGLASTGIFTAPVAGRYRYTFFLVGSAANSVTLNKTGTSVMTIGTGQTVISYTGTIKCAVGDTLKLIVNTTTTVAASSCYQSFELML